MYHKIILTVIAVALSVIAFKMPVASPAMAFGEACGSITSPCYITSADLQGLDVHITNLR